MSPSERAAEAATKVSRLRALLEDRGADAIVLTRIANFAWLTCGGRSFINVAAEGGAAWAVVDRARVTVLTSNIEARRLAEEEIEGTGFAIEACDWWDGGGLTTGLRRLLGGEARLLCDAEVPGAEGVGAAVAAMRVELTAGEQARAAAVGRDAALALEACCRAVRRGDTEFAIAGRLAAECYQRALEPVVHLVAADERVYTRRHPLPTGRALERYGMVVLCGMRDGLVLSCTRLIHFGPVGPDLDRRWRAAARVDAEMIAATRPGATSGQVFAAARQAYAATGFEEEWRNHHQGGLAGYASREWRAVPDGAQVIRAGQIFAWNPSVAGAKSEDTVLCREAGAPAVLTELPGWPAEDFETTSGAVLSRPGILILR